MVADSAIFYHILWLVCPCKLDNFGNRQCQTDSIYFIVVFFILDHFENFSETVNVSLIMILSILQPIFSGYYFITIIYFFGSISAEF